MSLRNLAIDIAFDAELGKIMAVDSAVDDIKSSAVDTGNSIEDLAGKTESAGSSMLESFESIGSELQSAGTKMSVGITAPLVGLATAAIHTVSSFDDSMSKVQAISGATSKEFDELREMAIHLGSTTAHSASAAADGMAIFATAGWEVNDILEGTPDLLSLASASGLELADAAGIMTTTINQFSLSATEDTERVADVFAKASSSSSTNVHELGEAMKYAGGRAISMNMDIEQTNAMLGVFAEQGLVSSQAGTAFSAMFTELSQGAEDGKIAIGKATVEVYDATGAMRDMGAIMTDVEAATDGMTDAQRDAALQNIFGQQAMMGVNAFLGEGSEKYRELEEAIYDSNGASQQMADDMEDNIGGAFRSMSSAIEGFMIVLGDELKPYVQTAAEFITDLAGKFGKLSDNTRKFIVIGGAIVAAIGPVLALFGTMLTMIGPAIAALTSPVGIAIAVIGGLVAAGIALYQNWETIKEKGHDVFSNFQPLFDTLKNSFDTFLSGLQPTWETLKELFQSLMPIIEMVAGIIGGVLITSLGITISTFSAVVAAINPFIQAVINIVDIVVNMVNVVVAVLTGDFAGAWEYLQEIGNSTMDFFINIFETIVTFVSTWVNTIVDFFHGLYMTLVGNSIIPDMVNAIIEWFVTLIASSIELVTAFVNGIVNGFINLVTSIGEQMNNAYNTIVSIWDTVMSFFSGIDLFQIGVDILQGLIDGIASMASELWSKVTEIGKGIADKFSGVLSIFSPSRLFKGFGIDTMLGYTIGFENEAENAVDAAEQTAVDISDVFGDDDSPEPEFSHFPVGDPKPPNDGHGDGVPIPVMHFEFNFNKGDEREIKEAAAMTKREFKKMWQELQQELDVRTV